MQRSRTQPKPKVVEEQPKPQPKLEMKIEEKKEEPKQEPVREMPKPKPIDTRRRVYNVRTKKYVYI